MSQPLKTIELFAGAGGMALGVQEAGFEHEALLEIDPAACETLRANRPAWPVVEDDVRQVDFGRYSGIDLLTAGAPCQPFSVAGMRRLGEDRRNLFPQVLRAVQKVRPRALLLENVKGMLLGEARPYFDQVIGRLGELGYDVSWRLLRCADYGVPQRRERVFVVGFRREMPVRWVWPEATHGLDALLYAHWADGSYWKEHGIEAPDDPPFKQIEQLQQLWPAMTPPPRRPWRTVRDALMPPAKAGEQVLLASPRYGDRANTWDQPASTITTRWNKTMLWEDRTHLRYLAISELAPLQAFPDTWQFTGTPEDQLRQLGNAVPSRVARVLCTSISQRL